MSCNNILGYVGIAGLRVFFVTWTVPTSGCYINRFFQMVIHFSNIKISSTAY